MSSSSRERFTNITDEYRQTVDKNYAEGEQAIAEDWNAREQKEWDNSDREGRLDILQRHENENAIRDGREPRTVEGKDYNNDSINGEYDHESNSDKIYVNEKYLDPENKDNNFNKDNAVNTTAHEGRHATQHDVVDETIDGKKAGLDGKQEELKQDLEQKPDYDGLSGEDVERAERSRPSERDAREYAAKNAPNAEISKSDTDAYKKSDELDDSVARINAYGEQSANDFDAYQKGEANQFSAGNSDKGHEKYQQRVTDRLQQINGGNDKQKSEPQTQTNKLENEI